MIQDGVSDKTRPVFFSGSDSWNEHILVLVGPAPEHLEPFVNTFSIPFSSTMKLIDFVFIFSVFKNKILLYFFSERLLDEKQSWKTPDYKDKATPSLRQHNMVTRGKMKLLRESRFFFATDSTQQYSGPWFVHVAVSLITDFNYGVISQFRFMPPPDFHFLPNLPLWYARGL